MLGLCDDFFKAFMPSCYLESLGSMNHTTFGYPEDWPENKGGNGQGVSLYRRRYDLTHVYCVSTRLNLPD